MTIATLILGFICIICLTAQIAMKIEGGDFYLRWDFGLIVFWLFTFFELLVTIFS